MGGIVRTAILLLPASLLVGSPVVAQARQELADTNQSRVSTFVLDPITEFQNWKSEPEPLAPSDLMLVPVWKSEPEPLAPSDLMLVPVAGRWVFSADSVIAPGPAPMSQGLKTLLILVASLVVLGGLLALAIASSME
jgi:hypothetical protein